MKWLFFLVILLIGTLWSRRSAQAYAEWHYRFLPGLSLLFRRRPEIYWDAPWRVEHGQPLPLAVLVKDADRFPVRIESVQFRLLRSGGKKIKGETERLWKEEIEAFFHDRRTLHEPFFFQTFWLPLPEELLDEPIFIRVACEATIGNRRHRFGPTSHPTFSDAPLRVFVASEPLPTFPGWSYAETHCHSWQTSNQVEFGAPPLLLAQMAQALGLRWVLITDHSFDLAMPSDLADPLETQDRWERLGQEIEEANRSVPGVRLIRAQEVSCGSAKGTNLHLLVYALERRLPGSGDSLYGRKLIDHRPDSWLAELVEEVHAAGGLAFASHPFTAIGRMEGRLLNRSVWGQEDLSLPHLTGWEFWNTEHPGHFQAARAAWIQGLREGLRPVAIAGSDAHGDFNRSRAISLPFLRVCEAFDEAFGKPRTAVETPNGTEAELYSALREGRAVLSNGPIACIELHTERRQYPMGSAVQEESGTLIVHARSSSEFGPLRRVTLYAARIGAQEERETVLGRRLGYSAEFRVALTVRERPAYVRVEAIAEREGRTTYALTNPIWFDKR